jgi:hypothetical protein
MVKTYSTRLLSPYTSPVQIAETAGARALSLDGRNWEVQCLVTRNNPDPDGQNGAQPTFQYARVAVISEAKVARRPLHPILSAEAVNTAIEQLESRVTDSSMPFAAIDTYEYWLLDAVEQKPLALLHSCTDPEGMVESPVRPVWMAMPAAQLEVEDPQPQGEQYVPPVNYRLQKLVEARAGRHPRGAWFDRKRCAADDFPACLISEAWDRDEHHELCQRYIRRLAPRLLMLQGLPQSDRERLEQSARDYAIEVDQFFALYPEVVDEKLMTALRVEAKLRLAAEPGLAPASAIRN